MTSTRNVAQGQWLPVIPSTCRVRVEHYKTHVQGTYASSTSLTRARWHKIAIINSEIHTHWMTVHTLKDKCYGLTTYYILIVTISISHSLSLPLSPPFSLSLSLHCVSLPLSHTLFVCMCVRLNKRFFSTTPVRTPFLSLFQLRLEDLGCNLNGCKLELQGLLLCGEELETFLALHTLPGELVVRRKACRVSRLRGATVWSIFLHNTRCYLKQAHACD